VKVLIACEFSGIVREAFAKKGHDAWSCDLLPTEIPGQHIQGDVLDIINDGWDMMIAFPPCTHLCSSGAVYWKDKQKDGRQQKAIEFFMKFINCKTKKVCVENPSGIISSIYRKPDQYVHPFSFGDPYYKRTGLWLKNLPKLVESNKTEPVAHWHSGSTRGGLKKDGTRTKSKLPVTNASDSKTRSRTFKGIAEAMADQWSKGDEG
jgi:hypothetical protein